MNFNTYWKEYGKVEDEVTKNCRPHSKLEEDFKKLAKKVWNEASGWSDILYDKAHSDGWDECEAHYVEQGKLKNSDLK